MPDFSKQPRDFDGVMGGQNPPPITSAVLGGLEGIQKRMERASVEGKIAALKEAFKYGQSGIDFVIEALDYSLEEVQWAAYLLLKTRSEPRAREALENYVPSAYRKLRELLETGQWKEGDRASAAVLLKLARREKEGWLRVEDINRLPGDELQILDGIWKECSNERFGFSIQKQIWQSVGTKYWVFGDRVGWRAAGVWQTYESFTFSPRAPIGHLPAAHLTWGALKSAQLWLWYGGTLDDVRWFELKTLLSRREF